MIEEFRVLGFQAHTREFHGLGLAFTGHVAKKVCVLGVSAGGGGGQVGEPGPKPKH